MRFLISSFEILVVLGIGIGSNVSKLLTVREIFGSGVNFRFDDRILIVDFEFFD